MDICKRCNCRLSNGESRFPLLCGHAFHRRCIEEQISSGRYNCPVRLCYEPILFVQLNRIRIGQRPVYIIPNPNLISNESRRGIEAIADLYNSSFYNLFNFLEHLDLVPTNVEDKVIDFFWHQIEEVIQSDNNDGVLDQRAQRLINDSQALNSYRLFFCRLFVAYIGDKILLHFFPGIWFRPIQSAYVNLSLLCNLIMPSGRRQLAIAEIVCFLVCVWSGYFI